MKLARWWPKQSPQIELEIAGVVGVELIRFLRFSLFQD